MFSCFEHFFTSDTQIGAFPSVEIMKETEMEVEGMRGKNTNKGQTECAHKWFQNVFISDEKFTCFKLVSSYDGDDTADGKQEWVQEQFPLLFVETYAMKTVLFVCAYNNGAAQQRNQIFVIIWTNSHAKWRQNTERKEIQAHSAILILIIIIIMICDLFVLACNYTCKLKWIVLRAPVQTFICFSSVW